MKLRPKGEILVPIDRYAQELFKTAESHQAFITCADAMIEKAHCGAMMRIEKVDVGKYSAGR